MHRRKKVILVTGASSGLGRAVAVHLSEQGHTVYAGARSFTEGAGEGNSRLRKRFLDVTDLKSIETFVTEAIRDEGRIDVLVNCAAMLVLGSVEDTSADEYEKVIETNLMGTIRMCRSVLPHMRRAHSGYIINFSSIMGLLSIPFQSAYSLSKFAIEGFSEAMRMEVKNFGIKVSILEPTDHKSGSQKYRPHAENAKLDTSPYRDLFMKVTEKIEYDEAHGSNPQKPAVLIEKILQKKNPKLRYKVGKFDQKLSVLLKRILPGRIFESVIFNYYKDGK